MDWSGWEQAVLRAGHWPVTPQNVRFLQEWHPYELSKCSFNPLNTTLRRRGSVNCVQTQTPTIWVQAYTGTTQGANATAVTLAGPPYVALAPALASGDPYSYPNAQGVAQDIRTWGTPLYAAVYLGQAANLTGGTTSGGDITAASAQGHRGYYDLRNSVGKHLPLQLERSRHLGIATLRLLSHRSRVRGR